MLNPKFSVGSKVLILPEAKDVAFPVSMINTVQVITKMDRVGTTFRYWFGSWVVHEEHITKIRSKLEEVLK
jgi:hypothetical protein